MDSRKSWNVQPTTEAMRSRNFIRELVDTIVMPTNPPQPMIPLSIGDPAVFGNFPPPSGLNEELSRICLEGKHFGYGPAVGDLEARKAVAASLNFEGNPVTAADVALTSGCSHALLVALNSIAKPGSNVLIPSPGFSLYRTCCAYLGVEARLYRLDPANDWSVDLKHVEELVDANTAAILVNNPSNPCGSNFSAKHVNDIVSLCERLFLPIIADEIYANMVFSGETFTSFTRVSQNVPLLLCGGTAKQFMIPGWRVGWVVICDRQGIFKAANVHTAISKLCQIILGPNNVAQGTIPFLLTKVPAEYHASNMKQLEHNATVFGSLVSKIEGLNCIMPKGAMYLMVGIHLESFPEFKSEMDFAQALVDEQQVFVLPGSCFTMPNYFRVVLCPPADKLEEAARRIASFCDAHRNKKKLN